MDLLKKLINEYCQEVCETEVYKCLNTKKQNFHTDNIEFISFGDEFIFDGTTGDYKVLQHAIMDAEEYDCTVLANCGETFEEFYRPDAKVLCIIVE